MKAVKKDRGNPGKEERGAMKELFKQYRICAILRNIPSGCFLD